MLRRITLKQYLIGSTTVVFVSYLYQLSLRQDCAWDGCYPASGYTYIGSLFGLPGRMLWLLAFIGLCIAIVRLLSRKR